MKHRARLTPLVWSLLTLAACSSASTTGALPDGAAPDAGADAVTPDAATPDAVIAIDSDPPRDDGKGVRGGPCASPLDCENDLAGRVCITSSSNPAGRCVECVPGMPCPDGVTVCSGNVSAFGNQLTVTPIVTGPDGQ